MLASMFIADRPTLTVADAQAEIGNAEPSLGLIELDQWLFPANGKIRNQYPTDRRLAYLA